ncbi:restriction endonuclease subunit S [Vibrio parahaemolyticus]|uniref:restriction endonuclease subunit S n=1 Tax=Vibrio parahaemolyticus TaxID=670 RepID=UPI001D16A493|nr:restriction endonuclease subunit S [Vibrio parahaemolyticus]MCC3857890.1 restriction endonuclease subunit S [Vibrio parahaemolyticus]
MGNFSFRKCKIPTTWRLGTLGEISTSFSNQRVPLKSADRKLRQGQYRYFGAQGVIDHIDDYIFDGKYLLVAEDGENVKSRKYDIAFVVEGKFWVNNHAHVLQGNAFGDTDYLRYVLNFVSIKEYVTGQAQPKLNKAQLEKIVITIPPLDEQQKIAKVLSTVDKKIDLIDQKIEETEKLKTGIMQKLFSEGVGIQDDNGNWNPHTEFKNSNFGSIPSTWEVKNLKQIGECFIGLTYKPEDTTDSSGTLVLRSSNVQNQRLCLSNNVYVKCQIPEKIQVKKGDILICVRNGSRALIGKSALIKKDMDNTTFGAFMSIFRSELSDLIYQLFQTEIYRKQIYKNLGATINQITNKNLYSFEFPIPPKEERQKIVNVLTTIDNNIDLLIKQKAETQQLKKGLMQKLLTGEWRVPVEETEAA